MKLLILFLKITLRNLYKKFHFFTQVAFFFFEENSVFRETALAPFWTVLEKVQENTVQNGAEDGDKAAVDGTWQGDFFAPWR